MLSFGTDGIRGKGEYFNKDFLHRFGGAIYHVFGKIVVAVARDTRLSGERMEGELIKALRSYGISVLSFGVIPTPTLAYLTKAEGCDLGIMISASHNPPEYNGLKLFSGQGAKISEALEKEIEEALKGDLKPSEAVEGGFKACDAEKYYHYLKTIFKKELFGSSTLVDACYGATTTVLREIFSRLGIEGEIINGEGDGSKINVDCGATCLSALKERSKGLSFAYDGDGDRVIAIKGERVYTGDEILYVLTKYFKKKDRDIKKVVGTVTSNYALERALKREGVELIRSEVGDRNVYECAVREGAIMGAESSGHVLLREWGETGDGILVSLMLMLIDKECDIEALLDYTPYPSVEGYLLANREEKERLKSSNVKNEIMDYAKSVGVRVVVRASGTEDKIRIIVEGENGEKIEREYKIISELVSKVIYQNMENMDNKSRCLGNQNKEIIKANYEELRENGVSILEDSLTVIEEGVEIGRGSVIYPFTHLKAGTRIGENVKIFPFTDLEDTVVGSGAEVRSTYAVGAVIGECATVGPFATLRKGAVVGKGCRVGNYVEVKNATLGEGVKVAHLAYVGDASVGARTNVGCGTVFANYNGKVKRRTEVGEGVFIGCNANLIAPLKIGDNAYIAGGTTIREDVEEGSFVITKSENESKKRK